MDYRYGLRHVLRYGLGYGLKITVSFRLLPLVDFCPLLNFCPHFDLSFCNPFFLSLSVALSYSLFPSPISLFYYILFTNRDLSLSVSLFLQPLSFFLSLSLALWNPVSPSRLSLCLSLSVLPLSLFLYVALSFTNPYLSVYLCLHLSVVLSLFFSLYLLSLFTLFVDSIFKFVIPKISEICKQLSKIFICFYCNSLSYTGKRAFPNRPA